MEVLAKGSLELKGDMKLNNFLSSSESLLFLVTISFEHYKSKIYCKEKRV